MTFLLFSGFWSGCSGQSQEKEVSIAPIVQPEVEDEISSTRFFYSSEVEKVDSHFDFRAEIPVNWQVEAIREIQALHFYDPDASGDSTLEQSQIFVRYFEAKTFLTLSTVTIRSQTESTIRGRPAVTYDIEKKSGVSNFPHQPSWRNERHLVTDIRSTDDSTATFYVFAKRPDLDPDVFDAFVQSVVFNPVELYYPVNSFVDRVTLKPFGIYVSLEDSPVQSERFAGYHTGADAEILESEAEEDVWVYAMSEGTVLSIRTAQGYGGVMAIQHEVEGKSYVGIYGHLDLKSFLIEEGERVAAGQKLGILGDAHSEETDGERKHLHFGLIPGREVNWLGYVQAEEGLNGWIDPVEFLKSREAWEPS